MGPYPDRAKWPAFESAPMVSGSLLRGRIASVIDADIVVRDDEVWEVFCLEFEEESCGRAFARWREQPRTALAAAVPHSAAGAPTFAQILVW